VAAVVLVVFAVASVVLAACTVPTPPPLPQIYGAGSTTAQIEIDQWRADAAKYGLSVNYRGLGGEVGRQDFIQGVTDFAVDELTFQGSEAGAAAPRQPHFAPVVGNGIGFMYHLDVNGTPVTNLRLRPATLAGIFTGEITNWDDPAITADNNGQAFPPLAITPVGRGDGDSTSLVLTEWIQHRAPDVYADFCKLVDLDPCVPTTKYPLFPGSQPQVLAEGVANYVAVPYHNGSITYVPFMYALEHGFPVAAVLNPAGYYVQPTAQNITDALTGAHTEADGTQDLNGVFDNPSADAYPLSVYSFAIVPTTLVDGLSTAKGNVLARFLDYAVCAGQVKSPLLDAASLPSNLVQEALTAIAAIPGAPTQPTLTACMAEQP
jgi:ABC-type phosphate transport system substrate-binding protein